MEELEVEPGQAAAQLQLPAGDVPPAGPRQPREAALGRPRPGVGRHLPQVVGTEAGGRRDGQDPHQERLRLHPQPHRDRRHRRRLHGDCRRPLPLPAQSGGSADNETALPSHHGGLPLGRAVPPPPKEPVSIGYSSQSGGGNKRRAL